MSWTNYQSHLVTCSLLIMRSRKDTRQDNHAKIVFYLTLLYLTTTLLIGILNVMAQIVVFVFSVTLTLTFDLCSIFCHTHCAWCTGISMRSFIRIRPVILGDLPRTHTSAHARAPKVILIVSASARLITLYPEYLPFILTCLASHQVEDVLCSGIIGRSVGHVSRLDRRGTRHIHQCRPGHDQWSRWLLLQDGIEWHPRTTVWSLPFRWKSLQHHGAN